MKTILGQYHYAPHRCFCGVWQWTEVSETGASGTFIKDFRSKEEALALRDYFGKTSPKVYRHMRADKDLYLSFFISAVQGCGKQLLAEVVALAKSEGYESLYLWTDSSCNHGYYSYHGFEKVAEFKSDEWKTDSNDYLTFIYRKRIE